MTPSRDAIEQVATRAGVEEGIARRALETSNGDIAVAVNLIAGSRQCGYMDMRVLNGFERFVDNVEHLVRHGGVSPDRAQEVLCEHDGQMLAAQSELDAYRDDDGSAGSSSDNSSFGESTDAEMSDSGGDEEKSFRERVEEIREQRVAENEPAEDDDDEKSFSERVAEIQDRRASSESEPETEDEEKSFRERVEEIREQRASTGTGPGMGGDRQRGRFVVPRNKHYLQKLEARARDGQANLVETAYALVGETYTHPTDLIPLDSHEFYLLSTRTQTSLNIGAMASEVASSYTGFESPKVIAKFHTHPGGPPSPSQADRGNAHQIYQSFTNAFGTDDFEFFHGIHGLAEHGRNLSPSDRQQPWITNNELVWDDDQYRHRLAVYGPRFQTRKPIVLDDSA